MNCYNLGGHSGCQIHLIEDDDGNVFVRKVSKDNAYNKRLEIQCEKQTTFKSRFIKAPIVYRQGYTEEGLFYFDMEYIQGMTLAEYIKTMEIGKVKGLVESLVLSLVPEQKELVTEEEKQKAIDIFSNKISELKKCLVNKNEPVITQALHLLENHDWSIMKPSLCHGDMTLENIIIRNDCLYYIDFLDSFYDSWFLDVGTLLQDVQVMWSYRFQNEVSMNTVLRLIVFRDLLLDEINKIEPSYVIEIYYALLQKLIRIFPYTTDEQTDQFLLQKTEMVLEKIFQLENERRAC